MSRFDKYVSGTEILAVFQVLSGKKGKKVLAEFEAIKGSDGAGVSQVHFRDRALRLSGFVPCNGSRSKDELVIGMARRVADGFVKTYHPEARVERLAII